jgi:glutamine synthetase
VESLAFLEKPEVKELFKKYGVLSERELASRHETYVEQYCLTVKVEANLVHEIASTMILPAALRYQGEVAATCANLRALGIEFGGELLEKLTALTTGLLESLSALETTIAGEASDSDHAIHSCEKVLPAMLEVRRFADQLEGVVADDLWPLPTYQEMLFIK